MEAIVSLSDYLRDNRMEIITSGGTLQQVPYSELKAACFAKEPARPDLFSAGNLFERRPKLAGLWTRFSFRDGDQLEGVLSHNLTDWPRHGYLITPPRAGLTRQLVFIPREAVSETQLLGVVGTPLGEKRKMPRRSSADNQLTMFDS